MAKKSDGPVKVSQLESLPPWELNTDAIKDEESAKKAEECMHKWLEELQKSLHELFSKNGIDTFELDFIHKGTKTPILLTKGNSYIVAKLALHAATETKKRVEEELRMP
jgi:hypothetical protein